MSWSAYLLSGLPLILLAAQLQAADLPAGATPGGALPNLDSEILEPFVYPDSALPPEPEQIRSTEIDAPRMLVRGFRIRGVKAHEAIGISQASIELLVKTEAQALLAGEASRGFTISMFESITSAIARFYRERGYFLARAFIPAQKVADGIVTINIAEGFIDQIVYRGNQLYSTEQLDALFNPLEGKSVFLDDIEQAVFIANDFPGLQASILFGPGLKPGSSAIQVNLDEQPAKGFISFDNYGSNFTGENRLRGNYQRHNLLGNADRLNMNLIFTLNPQNSLYYDIVYEQPLLDNRYLVGGSYSSNTFDVAGTLADLGINGTSVIVNGYMTRILSRARNERMTTSVDFSMKAAESKVISTVDSRDTLSVFGFIGDYAGTSWSSSNAYQQLNAKLSIGVPDFLGSMDSNGDGLSGRRGNNDVRASGGFTKINFDYLRVQRLTELQRLVYRFSAQLSSDLLTSLEQFSLGGPDTVRAYPVAEALMDQAWLASIEWRANASPEVPQTWFNGLQFSVFFDYAQGTLNDPLTNDIDSVTLSGLGFGIDARPFNRVQARVQLAFDFGDEPSDSQTLPFYFSLRHDF